MNFNRDLFVKCVRVKMKHEGITHRDAAKQIGVSASVIWQISCPTRKNIPGTVVLFNTCAWLGCTPNDFFIPNETNEQSRIQ